MTTATKSPPETLRKLLDRLGIPTKHTLRHLAPGILNSWPTPGEEKMIRMGHHLEGMVHPDLRPEVWDPVTFTLEKHRGQTG